MAYNYKSKNALRWCKKSGRGKIKTDYISRNYSKSPTRTLGPSSYIVIHYADTNGTAQAVRDYFQETPRQCSAHFECDGKSPAVLAVPLNKTAWAVGGPKYTDCDKTGGGTLYGKAKNTTSISIEMCLKPGQTNADIYAQAGNLAAHYCNAYSIPLSHVIRHFDVNGKHCPDTTIFSKSAGGQISLLTDHGWKNFVSYYVEPLIKTELRDKIYQTGITNTTKEATK
jgi:N-acetylmuramoyl-L-alanine amidase CwlA